MAGSITTKPNYLQPALVGGVIMGVLSALPFVAGGNLCCCLWVVSGGAIAAYLFQQNQSTPIATGDGALVGLLAGLIGLDAKALRDDDGLAGSLFETFVATELERQASWSPEPLSFWHYREGDHEVDVIVERPSGEILGIEVKASATVRPRDARGLKRVRERVGKRMVAGLVLYAGERTLSLGEGLWALPLSALWSAPNPSPS